MHRVLANLGRTTWRAYETQLRCNPVPTQMASSTVLWYARRRLTTTLRPLPHVKFHSFRRGLGDCLAQTIGEGQPVRGRLLSATLLTRCLADAPLAGGFD
jgi:hypothetical protein